jgi:hypothetical protein
MTIYSEITIPQLKKIISKTSNIFDIEEDTDSVNFKYKDKDQDNVLVIVSEIDDERIVSMMPMNMPDSRLLACLMAANNWNQRQDAHGTFAYIANSNDKYFVIIESHLMLRGGVEEENIRLWIKNLVNHINPFEQQIISTVAEIGEDSDLLKGNGSGLWSAIGEFAGSVFNAFLDDSGGGGGH